MKKFLLVTGLAASLLLSGCATTGGPAGSADAPVRSGFLSDYSKLKPVDGLEGTERYINRAAPIGSASKLYLDPVEVFVAADGAYKGVQPATLNRIAESFKQALVNEAGKGGYQIVDAPGPDVLRVRLAITGMQPVSPGLGVTDFIPIKALYNAGRAVSGHAPRTAEMSAELEVLNGAGEQVAIAVVSRKSDKNLAQGDSITWNDLVPIVGAWAKQFRNGLDELRKTSATR